MHVCKFNLLYHGSPKLKKLLYIRISELLLLILTSLNLPQCKLILVNTSTNDCNHTQFTFKICFCFQHPSVHMGAPALASCTGKLQSGCSWSRRGSYVVKNMKHWLPHHNQWRRYSADSQMTNTFVTHSTCTHTSITSQQTQITLHKVLCNTYTKNAPNRSHTTWNWTRESLKRSSINNFTMSPI